MPADGLCRRRGDEHRWGVDEWTGTRDAESIDAGLGVWLVDLDTAGQLAGHEVVFALFRHDAARRDHVTYRVTCVSRP